MFFSFRFVKNRLPFHKQLCEQVKEKSRRTLSPRLVRPRTKHQAAPTRGSHDNMTLACRSSPYSSSRTSSASHCPWDQCQVYKSSDTPRCPYRSTPIDIHRRRRYVYPCPNIHRLRLDRVYRRHHLNSPSWAKNFNGNVTITVSISL